MGQRKPSVIKDFLEEKFFRYNRTSFIDSDPVSIPHRFSKKEDIEISGFLTATIAWGQRKTILKNARELVMMMDDSPHEFILHFSKKDLRRFSNFKHRTFNGNDCTCFLQSLRNIYQKHDGLENLFARGLKQEHQDLREAITSARRIFFTIAHMARSEKHFSDPSAGSAAKRINMFLRWMVRQDDCGVDFGIWKSISPAVLSCPLDVHSGRVARKLGLLSRTQNDWKAVAELTSNLRKMCPEDPVKYDFALFGLGVFEKF
jgi:uncharacterized protein (TIGR02757 family)